MEFQSISGTTTSVGSKNNLLHLNEIFCEKCYLGINCVVISLKNILLCLGPLRLQ